MGVMKRRIDNRLPGMEVALQWQGHLHEVGAALVKGARNGRRHAHIPCARHQRCVRPPQLLLHS